MYDNFAIFSYIAASDKNSFASIKVQGVTGWVSPTARGGARGATRSAAPKPRRRNSIGALPEISLRTSSRWLVKIMDGAGDIDVRNLQGRRKICSHGELLRQKVSVRSLGRRAGRQRDWRKHFDSSKRISNYARRRDSNNFAADRRHKRGPSHAGASVEIRSQFGSLRADAEPDLLTKSQIIERFPSVLPSDSPVVRPQTRQTEERQWLRVALGHSDHNHAGVGWSRRTAKRKRADFLRQAKRNRASRRRCTDDQFAKIKFDRLSLADAELCDGTMDAGDPRPAVESERLDGE